MYILSSSVARGVQWAICTPQAKGALCLVYFDQVLGAHPKAGRITFFQLFSTFLFISNLFQWFQARNQQKNMWKWRKKRVFHILLTPQSWSTCKSWSTPWGSTLKLSFSVDFLLFHIFCQFLTDFGVIYTFFFVHFHTFFVDFRHEITEKGLKLTKKGWKRLKKVVDQHLGALSTQKLVEVHNTRLSCWITYFNKFGKFYLKI